LLNTNVFFAMGGRQALSEDVPIITSDTRFADYKRLRVVWD
jgi:hypothetical protein